MNRSSTRLLRSLLRGRIPILLGCILITGCGKWQPPRVVEVEGVEVLQSLSPLYGLMFAAAEDGEPSYTLIRPGELLNLFEEEIFIPYRPSDGGHLQLGYEEGRVTLAGRVIVLEILDDDDWEWLAGATPVEMSTLRLVDINMDVPAGRIELVENLAHNNRNLSLIIRDENALLTLLPLFDPPTLIIAEFELQRAHKDMLAQERQLNTLMISGEEQGDLSFLRQIENLQNLILSMYDPDSSGPIPDGLRNLRSINVAWGVTEDLSCLGDQPQLEELTVLTVEEEGEEPGALEISALAGFPNLTTLCLRTGATIEDLSPIAGLAGLRWMTIPMGTTQQQFEEIIEAHPGLTVLELLECSQITDLSPLGDLRGLEALILGSEAPPDPLFEMKGLDYLAVTVDLDDHLSYGEGTLTRLREALPRTAIARVAPLSFCLGSGFILLLVPIVAAAWYMAGRRRMRMERAPIHE